MVRTVLKWFLIGLIIVLIIAWFVGGGIGKVESVATDFSPFSSEVGLGAVQLPWAVPIPQGPDITSVINTATQQYQSINSQSSQSQTPQSETFGNQSPYANGITLSSEGAAAVNPQDEYVVIQNSGNQTVDLSGWSLQSALSGARAYIPLGASFFEEGQLNEQDNIELAPGGLAIVTSGESPVGTSFEENVCSGYLEQLQSYTPAIVTQCPSPGENTSQAAVYGQSCADFVNSLPFCTFPQNFPQGLTASCQTYAQTTFSYDGCVYANENNPDFPLNDWRIYLDATRQLWNSDHDTIRLLDSEGRVVAVTSY